MADDDVIHSYRFFQVLRSGTVKIHHPNRDRPDPPSTSSETDFNDVVISTEPDNITARIFIPKTRPDNQQLPIILYIHGGGFCMSSPYATKYHRYCSRLAFEANAVVVSVDYGLFPERPIPACYDDSWTALKWVASHGSGSGPDPWINSYGDFNNLFIAGDSAGGNICHTLAYRVGSSGLDGARLNGAVIVHPFFGGTEDDYMWMRMCPTTEGLNDPRMNPSESDLSVLGCERVLIFVGEKDELAEAGRRYYEKLKRSGWKGKVEICENLGRDHCFHLDPVTADDEVLAAEMMRKVAAFVRG